MPVEMFLSIATLGGFIWAIRFLVPKALRAGDGMAVTCAVLTAILALLLWLMIGIGARSRQHRDSGDAVYTPVSASATASAPQGDARPTAVSSAGAFPVLALTR